MEPNESPSIFPKQARDLRVLQEEELLPAFEDEPQDEQKPNVVLMLNTSHCKTRNTRAILPVWAGLSLSLSSLFATVKTYYAIIWHLIKSEEPVLLSAIWDQQQWTVEEEVITLEEVTGGLIK